MAPASFTVARIARAVRFVDGLRLSVAHLAVTGLAPEVDMRGFALLKVPGVDADVEFRAHGFPALSQARRARPAFPYSRRRSYRAHQLRP